MITTQILTYLVFFISIVYDQISFLVSFLESKLNKIAKRFSICLVLTAFAAYVNVVFQSSFFEFLLAIPIVIWGGWPLYVHSLQKQTIDIHSTIALSAIAIFFFALFFSFFFHNVLFIIAACIVLLGQLLHIFQSGNSEK